MTGAGSRAAAGLVALTIAITWLIASVAGGAAQYVPGISVATGDLSPAAGSTIHAVVDCGEYGPPASIRLMDYRNEADPVVATGTVDLAAGTATLVVPAATPPGSYQLLFGCTSADGTFEGGGLQIRVTAAPTSATPAFTG